MSKNKTKAQSKPTNVKAEAVEVKETPVVAEKAAVNDDSTQTAKKKNTKTVKQKDKKPNIFQRMWKSIKGTFSELKKVTWPKGKDVLKSGIVVLLVVFAFFIILFGIDYVLAGILSLIKNGTWATIFVGV